MCSMCERRVARVLLFLSKTWLFMLMCNESRSGACVRGRSSFSLQARSDELSFNAQKCFVPPLEKERNVSHPGEENEQMLCTRFVPRPVSYKAENVSYPHTPIWKMFQMVVRVPETCFVPGYAGPLDIFRRRLSSLPRRGSESLQCAPPVTGV